MNKRSLLKRFLLAAAMVGAFGFATAGTASEAEARHCYRGGGFGPAYGVGYGGFYGRPANFYRAPAYGVGYRGFYGGRGFDRGFYGGRGGFYGGRGVGIAIGF